MPLVGEVAGIAVFVHYGSGEFEPTKAVSELVANHPEHEPMATMQAPE